MNYRRDIDGLRAIAVLAVVLFHFRFVGFGGGYIGVDIFFVISGYLIGGLIVDETASGIFTYARFYTRRIKRLFAAFFVMAVATVPIAWWLSLPLDFSAHAKSLVASTVFVPNLLFYRDAGYFDAAAITKPLLHTWSLAVEEQFYIFFPVVLHVAARAGPRWIPAVLVAITVTSLAYAQHLVAVDPSAAFYWLPSRAWEMTLGALVALPALRKVSLPVGVERGLTAMAMAALLASILLLTESTLFPGLAALPACAATAWLLWLGRSAQGGWVQRGLSTALPVAIGRISYSLYLWHWPVIVFFTYQSGGDLSGAARFAALVLVFVLSVLSWRFVEQPIRYSKRSPRVVFGSAALASVALATLGFGIWRTGGMPDRLPTETRLIADATSDFFRPNARCVGSENTEWPGVAYCRLGPTAEPPRFLIWGDSHARAVLEGASQLAQEVGASGMLLFAGSCMPAFGVAKIEPATGPRSDAACLAQNRALQSTLERPTSIRKILLVGRWAYYAEGRGVGVDAQTLISVRPLPPETASADQSRDVALAMSRTVRWLQQRGYEVYLLEQPPEIPEFSSRKLFVEVRGGRSDVATAIDRFGTVSRAAVEQRQRRGEEALLQAAGGDASRILRTHPFFCQGDRCSAWWAPRPAYFDNNHMTETTAVRIREIFRPIMLP